MNEHDLVLDIRNMEGTFTFNQNVNELQIEAYAAGADDPVVILLEFKKEDGGIFFQSIKANHVKKWFSIHLTEAISGTLVIARPLLDDLPRMGIGVDSDHSLVISRIRFR